MYYIISISLFYRVYSKNDNDSSTNDDIDLTGAIKVSIEITNALSSEQNIDQLLNVLLPPHQRCTAHTLNLIASVDTQEAEKDFAYRTMSLNVFKKCQAIFDKQNQSTLCADIIKNHLRQYLITPNATRYL